MIINSQGFFYGLSVATQQWTYCEIFTLGDADCFVMKKIGKSTSQCHSFLYYCKISCHISRNCLSLKKFKSIWKRMVKNLVWYVVVIVVKTDATIHTKHNRSTYLPSTTNTTSLIVDKNGHNMYTSTCNMIWWNVKGMSMYIGALWFILSFHVFVQILKYVLYLLCNMGCWYFKWGFEPTPYHSFS